MKKWTYTISLIAALSLASALADTPIAKAPSGIAAQPSGITQDSGMTPDWMIGTFAPGATASGSDPEGTCLLTVTSKQLTFAEKPGGSARVLAYRIVVSNSDFIVVQTEESKASQKVCVDGPMPVLRFDHKDYLQCVEDKLRKGATYVYDESAEKACPRPFGIDPEDFDLTVYSGVDDALHIAHSVVTDKGKAVMYWSGYWKQSH